MTLFFFFFKTSIEGEELFLMTKLEVLNLLLYMISNQFPPNVIRSIGQFERITKKYEDKKCL